MSALPSLYLYLFITEPTPDPKKGSKKDGDEPKDEWVVGVYLELADFKTSNGTGSWKLGDKHFAYINLLAWATAGSYRRVRVAKDSSKLVFRSEGRGGKLPDFELIDAPAYLGDPNNTLE